MYSAKDESRKQLRRRVYILLEWWSGKNLKSQSWSSHCNKEKYGIKRSKFEANRNKAPTDDSDLATKHTFFDKFSEELNKTKTKQECY